MSPGPAQYNPSASFTQSKSPGAVMGTGARSGRKGAQNGERTITPGPGSYNIGNTGAQDPGASTWGTSNRGSQLVSKHDVDLPGPGAYNHDRQRVMCRS